MYQCIYVNILFTLDIRMCIHAARIAFHPDSNDIHTDHDPEWCIAVDTPGWLPYSRAWIEGVCFLFGEGGRSGENMVMTKHVSIIVMI